ncbi:UNVERIFIED_CONTAM: hypothetical protein Sradi_2523500 [Sesamum radiatum]|uniref:Uncharacterized protein n=1 Tax=Sesamum radiatum TaxID=300843 RepID=A0AAW2SLR7_SESRA
MASSDESVHFVGEVCQMMIPPKPLQRERVSTHLGLQVTGCGVCQAAVAFHHLIDERMRWRGRRRGILP